MKTFEPLPKISSIEPDQIRGLYSKSYNKLDAFDNVTYHLKLFTIKQSYTDAVMEQCRLENPVGDSINLFGTLKNPIHGEDYIILASSGGSGHFSIDNLQFTSFPAISHMESGIGNFGKLTFTITESHGAVFFDYVIASSDILKIKNYLKCPMYLEISFKGDVAPVNSLPNHFDSTNIPNVSPFYNLGDYPTYKSNDIGFWTQPIYISTVNLNMTEGGSIYQCEAVSGFKYHGEDHENAYVKASLVDNIPNNSTIYTAFNKLAEILNNREKERTTGDNRIYCVEDKWAFYLDKEFEKMQIDSKELNKRAQDWDQNDPIQRSGNNTSLEGGISITVDQGLHVGAIIDTIMECVPEIQDGVINENEDSKNIKKIWKTYTNAIQLQYDNLRDDYAVERQYHILKYESTNSNLTKPGHVIKSPNEQTSLERLSYHLSTGTLRKFYEYIYTGHNTQIIDFETNFKFAWYELISRQKETKNTSFSENVTEKDGSVKNIKSIDEFCSFVSEEDNRNLKKPLSVSPTSQLPLLDSTNQKDNAIFLQQLMHTEHEKANADLLTIWITIKGDPYWMDPPSEFEPYYIRSVPQVLRQMRLFRTSPFEHDKDNHLGRYHPAKDIYLYLSFRTPKQSFIFDTDKFGNAGTGVMDNSSLLGGIYQILEVTHTFDNGVFKQKIKAIRDKGVIMKIGIQEMLNKTAEFSQTQASSESE